jgi:hypothetical protein
MTLVSPLLADVDWIRLAIFMVVGVGYLISFVATRLRERQVAKNRAPRPARPNADTAKELEAFLKRSAANRRDAAKKPAPQVARPQKQLEPSARSSKPLDAGNRIGRRKPDDREKRRRTASATPATPASSAMPSLVNLRESNLTKDREKAPSVGQVRPSIDTHEFAERASHLGSLDTEHALQDHLKQTFSHQVGTLSSASDNLAAQNRAAAATAAATGNKQALPIAALLRGGNMRNAVILNEILQRPEERW